MIFGGNQHLDLIYRINQSELEYYHGCTIGTATNSELGHEKQVILLKMSIVVQLIGHSFIRVFLK